MDGLFLLAVGGDLPVVVEDLAVALGVAAITSVICRGLGASTVLGYLLAGVIVGPYLAIPIFADTERIKDLSELGVVLVMFAIGLEFSIGRLLRAIPRAGLVALAQISLMMWLGVAIGSGFGWSTIPSLFLGACLAISSTMVVARALADNPVDADLSDLVYGVLVIQDLAAVVLVAILTAVASGAGVHPDELVITVARLFGFLALMVTLGLLIVPRLVRRIGRLRHAESMLVATVGLCFVLALIAARSGYSVALGAFLAGTLVAESGEQELVETLVQPLRDLFAAVFFVSVGMLVDPLAIVSAWPRVLLVAGVVIGGQLLVVSIAAFLSGRGLRHSIQAGFGLGQIGEFSFIIAGIGAASGVVDTSLMPVIVAAAAITAMTTPVLLQRSAAIAAWVDRKLPERLQTIVTLYDTWIASIRAQRAAKSSTRVRRAIRAMVIDVVGVAVIVVASALTRDSIVELAAGIELEPWITDALLAALTLALCIPFILGLLRNAGIIGSELASSALPDAPAGAVDRGQAPRRVLAIALRLGVVAIAGLTLLASTGPFLPGWLGAPALGVTLGVLALFVWRSADNLQGHVRAGAEVVAELLRTQSSTPGELGAHVQAVLPGLGEVDSLHVTEDLPCCGRTLAEIDLRGRTGATVLAIDRADGPRIVPSASEPLKAGDTLALAGSREAVDRAIALLSGAPENAAES